MFTPSRRRPPGSIRRHWLAMFAAGLDPETAGNLTAYALGLRPTRGGWTPAELARLAFLRWLYRRRDRLR